MLCRIQFNIFYFVPPTHLPLTHSTILLPPTRNFDLNSYFSMGVESAIVHFIIAYPQYQIDTRETTYTIRYYDVTNPLL